MNKAINAIKAFLLFVFAYILFILIAPIIFIINIIIFHKINYIWNCAIGIDQAGGSILYNEKNFTISSYTYWLCKKGNILACDFMKVIDFIFGKYHCERSYYKEIKDDEEDILRRTL